MQPRIRIIRRSVADAGVRLHAGPSLIASEPSAGPTAERIAPWQKHIGFIGLGVMGKPMAKHLLAGRTSPGRAQPQPRRGGRARGGRRDRRGLAGRGRAAVDGRHHDAARHRRRRARADRPRRRARPASSPAPSSIDMSSISPVATKRLAALVAEKGGSMLDAPVSGGEIGAINATLSIMVGGDEAAFDARAADSRVHGQSRADRPHRRESGAGQICKVCNQVAIGGALAGVSEAFALAKKAGVDAARVRQALLGGFAASRVLEVHGERMLDGQLQAGLPREAVSEGSADRERGGGARTASRCRRRRSSRSWSMRWWRRAAATRLCGAGDGVVRDGGESNAQE